MRLQHLKNSLTSIVKTSKNPILAWSGGKDSTLLLMILKQLGYNIPCLVFPHFWSGHQKEFVKRMVSEQKLQCFFYRPTTLEFVSGIPDIIVANYSLGARTIPVMLETMEDTSRCAIDLGNKAIQGVVPYFVWDTVILGTKRADEHPQGIDYDFNDWDKLELPLWDWSDKEVIDITKTLRIPYDERVYDNGDERADTGNFVGCTRCFGSEEVFCPKVNHIIRGIL